MEEPELLVKHFLACSRIEVERAAPDNPYTLHDVRYSYVVPPECEWPIRLDELWLFVRFYNGSGTGHFTVSVVWLDAPGGENQEVAFFDTTVYFPGSVVLSRGWNVSAVRYPGPGRYTFRLIADESEIVLADDFLHIGREV